MQKHLNNVDSTISFTAHHTNTHTHTPPSHHPAHPPPRILASHSHLHWQHVHDADIKTAARIFFLCSSAASCTIAGPPDGSVILTFAFQSLWPQLSPPHA